MFAKNKKYIILIIYFRKSIILIIYFRKNIILIVYFRKIYNSSHTFCMFATTKAPSRRSQP